MTHFETETCSRCKGSGTFSYCQRYGYKCFRCAGSGKTLTKRGAIARQYFLDSCMIALSEVKLGDTILQSAITMGGILYSYGAKVVEIERSSSPVTSFTGETKLEYFPLCIRTEHAKYGRAGMQAIDTSLVRIYRADDDKRLAAALEYQASLTKCGELPKRKKGPSL